MAGLLRWRGSKLRQANDAPVRAFLRHLRKGLDFDAWLRCFARSLQWVGEGLGGHARWRKMDCRSEGNDEASSERTGDLNGGGEKQTGGCGDPNVALTDRLRPPKRFPGLGRRGWRARTR